MAKAHKPGGKRTVSQWLTAAAKTALLFALLAAYALVGGALADNIGWPEAYGFSCYRKLCVPSYIWHSNLLISTGQRAELLLFAWIWMPIVAIIILPIAAHRSYLRRVKALKAK